MKRPKLVNNEIYHVYNRGVEKREVFLEDKDYLRFIHDLFEFNDQAPALNFNHYSNQSLEVGLPHIKPRKLLVEIMAFCLMPNHFHLMVRQKREGGITAFMRKLGTGYTNYFNQKYHRVGSLFQGKYKIIHITEEEHFIHLPFYIHFNPLDLVEPRWKERRLKDADKASKFLESYRWSSYPDYIGKKNFPSVTQRQFLLEFFRSPGQYKVNAKNWLKEIGPQQIESIVLENLGSRTS